LLPPVPRQQLVEPFDGVIGDPGDHVTEPGAWIDVVQFRGRDQRINRRGTLAASIGTGEEP
jgi:hypothetical protein